MGRFFLLLALRLCAPVQAFSLPSKRADQPRASTRPNFLRESLSPSFILSLPASRIPPSSRPNTPTLLSRPLTPAGIQSSHDIGYSPEGNSNRLLLRRTDSSSSLIPSNSVPTTNSIQRPHSRAGFERPVTRRPDGAFYLSEPRDVRQSPATVQNFSSTFARAGRGVMGTDHNRIQPQLAWGVVDGRRNSSLSLVSDIEEPQTLNPIPIPPASAYQDLFRNPERFPVSPGGQSPARTIDSSRQPSRDESSMATSRTSEGSVCGFRRGPSIWDNKG